MADGDLILENGRMRLRTDMNDRAVLNIRSRTDTNEIDIAANDRAVPDARVLADLDVTDDDRVVGDEGGLVDRRTDFLELTDHKEISRKVGKDAKKNKYRAIRTLISRVSFELHRWPARVR